MTLRGFRGYTLVLGLLLAAVAGAQPVTNDDCATCHTGANQEE